MVLFTDIDECVASLPPCDQLCTNNPGSFECSCYVGYTLDNDGRTCNGTYVHCTHSPMHTYAYTHRHACTHTNL